MRTIFPQEDGESGSTDIVLTQETAESAYRVRFPVRIKRHGQALARIYRPHKNYPNYGVAWAAGGRRQTKAFPSYSEARRHVYALVRQMAQGSQASALTARQAADALASLERLRGFHQSTGRRVSLVTAVSEYCKAAGKLEGRTLGEAVEGYVLTVAVAHRSPRWT